MALNLAFEYSYQSEPFIPIRLTNTSTGLIAATEAIVDTGSQASLFDESIARRLGLELPAANFTRNKGVGAGELLSRPAITRVSLLGLEELSEVMNLGFARDVENTTGNLIGQDILVFFDLAISHRNRILYLGRSEGA
jgi:hypothetical protein